MKLKLSNNTITVPMDKSTNSDSQSQTVKPLVMSKSMWIDAVDEHHGVNYSIAEIYQSFGGKEFNDRGFSIKTRGEKTFRLKRCASLFEEMFELLRWPAGNIICPKCNSWDSYRLLDGKTYKCRNKECGIKFKSFYRTVFSNTKTSLEIWILAIDFLLYNKPNSCEMARQLGITQKSAWWLKEKLLSLIDFEDHSNVISVLTSLLNIPIKERLSIFYYRNDLATIPTV